MSGHSKWHQIKHKKGAIDAKRGKVFTTHAKLIAIAARNGGDPDMNPSLRGAIDRAKADNVPNANIDRAIKKGTGDDKEGTVYEEITYEAFGPNGSSFMIDVITDNKNRALGNIRVLLSKNGGNLANAGSVAWKFEKKAYFLVDATGKNDVELALIDCGADDLVEAGDGKYEVFAAAESLGEVKKALVTAGFKVEKDELAWKAKESVKIQDDDSAEKIMNLWDLLEEDEDVKSVNSDVMFVD